MFLNNRRRLSPVKNSGSFHACFSSVFLPKIRGNWTSGFGILEKPALLMFWGVLCGGFCGVMFWLRFGSATRLLFIFAVLGQRLARENHGASGKSRWVNGVLR